MTRIWTPDSQALAPYRQAQQQAYKAVQTIANALQPGMNEADTAHLLRDWLRAHQLHDPARAPQARFLAERQTPRGPFGLNRQGKRRYRPGMIYRLQCDAVLNGHCARAVLTGNPDDSALQQQLPAERQTLLAALKAGQTLEQYCAGQGDGLQRQVRSRLMPLTGTLPDGLPRHGLALLPGLWQLQLTLRDGARRAAFSELLVVDSETAGWLEPDLSHCPTTLREQAA
ncbi:hypothetical protein A11A3_07860 [Alcanivorax hongdengensis A-11-3]|uniref:Peptidase M24 domain-containing protein n=1 Tax=Alcanivorax hongdengensis A-11-3 TaxID=1177179 RepID=L0WFD9_9GAMM|nr:M24 family metallopeptidase [Alcanivorax hongdengensis]EKF74525.1 hypothetical protein A11A3_07860 [Alcanivorax hongdengensis A-11-3]